MILYDLYFPHAEPLTYKQIFLEKVFSKNLFHFVWSSVHNLSKINILLSSTDAIVKPSGETQSDPVAPKKRGRGRLPRAERNDYFLTTEQQIEIYNFKNTNPRVPLRIMAEIFSKKWNITLTQYAMDCAIYSQGMVVR